MIQMKPEDDPARMEVPGYESLAAVLHLAYDQAARGKGKERHAEDKPFTHQPMQSLIDLYGPGFALGQAGKKMQESQRMGPSAAERELLGAIVYIAGAVIHMKRQRLAIPDNDNDPAPAAPASNDARRDIGHG